MILNADAKALEWVCATYLSQDTTAMTEIKNEIDQHTDNQNRFGLPSRLIAKTFVFRLIYVGNEDYWQNIIDEFYRKYTGLKDWHDKIFADAKRDLKLTMPTGRTYLYPTEVNSMGKVKYPRTRILNYPVQGLGADLMAIARVSLRNRLKDTEGIKIINTVHDSIMLDFDTSVCYTNSIVETVKQCFEDIPSNYAKLFGKEFNLPMRVDIQLGTNWGNLEDVT